MEKPEYEATYRLEDSHWWFVGMRRVADSLLQPYLQQGERPCWALDAGCGTGGNSTWLSGYAQRLINIDISPIAIGLFESRGSGELVQGSAADMPFQASTFDLITSFDVVSQIPADDDRRALQEFFRLLRPGGLLLVRVPAYEWLRAGHDEVLHTTKRYTRGELISRLRESGFRVLRATHANSFLFPAAAGRRMLQKAGVIGTSTDLVPMPGVVNQAFTAAMGMEARIVSRFDIPLGLSIMVVARKPFA